MCLVCKEFVFLQTQFFLISMKVKSILISQPKPEIKNSPNQPLSIENDLNIKIFPSVGSNKLFVEGNFFCLST